MMLARPRDGRRDRRGALLGGGPAQFILAVVNDNLHEKPFSVSDDELVHWKSCTFLSNISMDKNLRNRLQNHA
jgi:hypothetical protein